MTQAEALERGFILEMDVDTQKTFTPSELLLYKHTTNTGIDQYIQVHTRIYQYILVHTSKHSYVLEHTTNEITSMYSTMTRQQHDTR